MHPEKPSASLPPSFCWSKGLALKNELTVARLRELLRYDADTGRFTRLKSLKGGAKIGDVAGALESSNGYWRIGVDGTLYYAHRLAWLHTHGVWPRHFIDHINGVRTDNRLLNLREADDSQNQQAQGLKANNSSGVRGVYWHKQRQRWHAEIMVGQKKRSLGLYDTLEEAAVARAAAQAALHPYAIRNDAR